MLQITCISSIEICICICEILTNITEFLIQFEKARAVCKNKSKVLLYPEPVLDILKLIMHFMDTSYYNNK